jgi:hypothetical protein
VKRVEALRGADGRQMVAAGTRAPSIGERVRLTLAPVAAGLALLAADLAAAAGLGHSAPPFCEVRNLRSGKALRYWIL